MSPVDGARGAGEARDAGDAGRVRDGDDPVGSRASASSAVVEELLRLLQAWQEDLRGHGGPECRSCPVCQLIAAIRNTRPEVLEHLACAVGEVASALRSVIQPAGAPPATRPARTQPGGGAAGGRARSRQPAPVERIDVTESEVPL